MSTLNLAGLIALFGTVTMIIVQTVKPLYDKIPGILLPANRRLHDNFLRLLQYAVNLTLLVLAARFGGQSMFAGWMWWDFLSVAVGQSVASHVAYKYGSQGGSPNPSTLLDAVVKATLAPSDLAQGQVSDIPDIPRP